MDWLCLKNISVQRCCHARLHWTASTSMRIISLWLERFQSRCWTCEIFAASFVWRADSSVLANRFCVFSTQTLFLACPPQDILVCVSCAASLRCWSPSVGCSNLVVGSTWVASSCPSNWPGPCPSTRARWASGKCAPCFLSVCSTAAAARCKNHFLITDDESSAAISIQLARLYCMSCLLKGKSGLKQASAHPTLFTLGCHLSFYLHMPFRSTDYFVFFRFNPFFFTFVCMMLIIWQLLEMRLLISRRF